MILNRKKQLAPPTHVNQSDEYRSFGIGWMGMARKGLGEPTTDPNMAFRLVVTWTQGCVTFGGVGAAALACHERR